MCLQGYHQLLLQHYFLCKNALMVSFTTFTCSSQYYFCPEGCFHQTRHLRSDTLTSAVGIANNIHKTGVTHISVSSLVSATVTAEHKAFLPLCPLIPPWICFWLLSCRSLSLSLSLWLCTLFPWKILPVIIVGIGWCHCACSVFETGQGRLWIQAVPVPSHDWIPGFGTRRGPSYTLGPCTFSNCVVVALQLLRNEVMKVNEGAASVNSVDDRLTAHSG